MFDILVDQPRKRLYACLIMIGIILELVLLLDLLFAFDVLRSSTFTELLDLQSQNGLSFYSYFFFSCLSSGAAYASFSLGSILTYAGLILQALSIWDWLLVIALVFLFMSHRSAPSKVTLCILAGFFMIRLLVLAGISGFLISAMHTNSAGTVLNRIQISSIAMIFFLVFGMLGNGYWTVRLIRKNYLELFKEKDSL